LTLSLVDRIGIFNIFSAKNELSIFFVMLFSKIESLKKEMNEFSEAAISRGLRMDSMKESIGLLSIIVTALLLRSLEGFRTSTEALKSRGQSA
jgi:energy-coupling factor transporter transmembrane protein EcfT